ncbi:hypothetical protein CEXT_82851, partial [Caerostris extrusa]
SISRERNEAPNVAAPLRDSGESLPPSGAKGTFSQVARKGEEVPLFSMADDCFPPRLIWGSSGPVPREVSANKN